jgi:hypothetical protein
MGVNGQGVSCAALYSAVDKAINCGCGLQCPTPRQGCILGGCVQRHSQMCPAVVGPSLPYSHRIHIIRSSMLHRVCMAWPFPRSVLSTQTAGLIVASSYPSSGECMGSEVSICTAASRKNASHPNSVNWESGSFAVDSTFGASTSVRDIWATIWEFRPPKVMKLNPFLHQIEDLWRYACPKKKRRKQVGAHVWTWQLQMAIGRCESL